MKNKTKIYILLTLVLSIWGVIGHKIISAVNPASPEIIQQNFDTSFNPKTNTEIDTFSIKPSERDPFLGTLYIKKKSIQKKIKPKELFVWLPIVYHGNISKQDSKTKVFIISIDNEQHLMTLGQVIKGVKLIRGNNSNIIVSYKGVRKTMTKT